MNTTDLVQKHFEPQVADTMRSYGDFTGVCLASIAVSMKRLADALSPAEGQDANFLANLFHTLDGVSHNHAQRVSR